MSAMAYLVRRLDENTAPENFLHDMFAIRPGSPEWHQQRERFEQGWRDRHRVTAHSRRQSPAVQPATADHFENEPDSDWTQRATRDRLNVAIAMWKSEPLPALPDLDPMLATAQTALANWFALGVAGRQQILLRAAEVMGRERFQAIACMRAEAHKAASEADGEVSEAIDFARYYARHAAATSGVDAKPLGVVAVVSPWNFPYAIPAGGVIAALMAGNSVVLKPSRVTAQTAWLLIQQLWAAGVPRDVLHFYPCVDGEVGKRLITDPRIAAVVLTGSYATARKFQNWRPTLPLFAETSGKNALVITAQADRELAIKDLVRSAFGHAGQKCSAASLAIIEAEVYDDPVFRRQLLDAASSLHVGPASDPRSVVTPLVIPPGSDLQRALTQLDEGESWLLQPRRVEGTENLWSPGIKLGVKPGSWFHKTECFGPVLGLMRATSLAEATAWQNDTDYGLTAGLHTLDDHEIAWWREHVQAGNLYINRPITGAIVQRQPFGGWKRSCIGPGPKAGGPNYVGLFSQWQDAESTKPDYAESWQNHFAQEHDPSALRCEANAFRYRPCRGVIMRLDRSDTRTLNLAYQAAQVTGVRLITSFTDEESDEVFAARLSVLAADAEFFRTVSMPSEVVLRAVHEAGLNWIHAPVLTTGRIELTRWLREQSVTRTLHRYGQI